MRIPSLATLLLLATMCATPRAALAAQSYDNCAYFIDSLPAVLDKQGVYCLRKDLSTAIASGKAIDVQVNNVTLDCNDFKIGGLAAGDGSQTRGITAYSVLNTTIRRCNIRGFRVGIALSGAGHLVEDNRLDNNLTTGILALDVENLRVRRNAVYDTGNTTDTGHPSIGIDAGVGAAEIADNVVDGVFTSSVSVYPAYGIRASIDGTIAGNRIGNLKPANTVEAWGIYAESRRVWITGNQVLGSSDGTVAAGTAMPGYGIQAVLAFCTGNTVGGFAHNFSGCRDPGSTSRNFGN